MIAAVASLGASGLSACGSSAPRSLTLVDSALGQVVADAAGRTLYAYTPDAPGDIACVEDCVHDWPPATAVDPVSTEAGLDEAKVGTVTRAGGLRQLTYGHHLLYRWVGDRAPGDVRGQAIGGVWFVVQASGQLLQVPPLERPRFPGHVPTTLTVLDSRLGPIVADASGAPLYAYRDDTAASVACTGVWCPTDWPPESAGGAVSTAEGITAAVSTLVRPDGLLQVVLGGHPLYRFSADLRPGDLRGLGIGGDWFAVKPDGTLVTDKTG